MNDTAVQYRLTPQVLLSTLQATCETTVQLPQYKHDSIGPHAAASITIMSPWPAIEFRSGWCYLSKKQFFPGSTFSLSRSRSVSRTLVIEAIQSIQSEPTQSKNGGCSIFLCYSFLYPYCQTHHCRNDRKFHACSAVGIAHGCVDIMPNKPGMCLSIEILHWQKPILHTIPVHACCVLLGADFACTTGKAA